MPPDRWLESHMPGQVAKYHRAEVNGIDMFYRRAGSGEPVVLLHGFPETSYAWRKVMPALAEHYTVIAPDLRGCGASDRPATGYSKRTVASDIRRRLPASASKGRVNSRTSLADGRQG